MLLVSEDGQNHLNKLKPTVTVTCSYVLIKSSNPLHMTQILIIRHHTHMWRCASCNSFSSSCCARVSLMTSFREHGGAWQHPPQAAGFVWGARSVFTVVTATDSALSMSRSSTKPSRENQKHYSCLGQADCHTRYPSNSVASILWLVFTSTIRIVVENISGTNTLLLVWNEYTYFTITMQ